MHKRIGVVYCAVVDEQQYHERKLKIERKVRFKLIRQVHCNRESWEEVLDVENLKAFEASSAFDLSRKRVI